MAHIRILRKLNKLWELLVGGAPTTAVPTVLETRAGVVVVVVTVSETVAPGTTPTVL